MSRSVLFVDDEKDILNSLKRFFRKENFTTHYALSANEAYRTLHKEKIDMIISDMRMPDVSGYQLLHKVKEKFPNVVRVILSGYADKNEILKAVVDGTAKIYIMKPWEPLSLVKTIEHLFAVRAALSSQKLLEKIHEIDTLPVLPSLYNKIVKLIKEDKEIPKIASAIEDDPGSTSRILSIVNSAFYGGGIGSIERALVFLGRNTIKNTILYSEILSVLETSAGDNSSIELLWTHSKMVNKIVAEMYKEIHNRNMPEEISSVGLLHDIGKFAMLKYYPNEFETCFKEWKGKSEKTFSEIEHEVLEISHGDIGAYLLDWWNLPSPFVEVCLYHHDPLNNNVLNKDLLCLVYVADYYSWKKLGYGTEENRISEVFDNVPLEEEDIKRIVDDVFETLKSA